MAESKHLQETTFRSFNNEQGKNYAKVRFDYDPSVYKTMIDRHVATGGKLDTLVDVGCGPGTATRSLAQHFAHAVGFDPSKGMITTAQSLGGTSSTSEPIRFEVSAAEDLGSLPDSSVDLITAATAAHWFDMPRFWARAANVLKPGGTVALWSSGSVQVDPSVPNAAGVQAALDEHEELLKDYMVPGNLLTRNLYVDLPLPWTLATPVPEFDKSTFHRKEWGTDKSASEPRERFLVGEGQGANLAMFETMLSTSSPVVRWREAHPDAVDTETDVVRIMRRNIERALYDAGVEKGKEEVKGGVAAVMLIVKKEA